MLAVRVGTGDPHRAGDDTRVEEIAQAPRLAEHTWTDVALGELGVGGEVLLGERLGLRRQEGGLEPFGIDVAVARHADDERFAAAVGVLDDDDDVLQRVGSVPRAVVPAQVVAPVEQVDEGGDGGRVRGIHHRCRRDVVGGHRVGRGDGDGLDVGGEVARRALHEGVLAGRKRGEELLALDPPIAPDIADTITYGRPSRSKV